MMKNIIKITKFITIIISVLFITLSTATNEIKAADEDESVFDYGTSITDQNVIPLTFKKELINSDLKQHNDTSASFPDTKDPDFEMIVNPTDPYTITYPAALDYFGKDLTVVVEVSKTKEGNTPAAGWTNIYRRDDRVWVAWRFNYDVNVKWKISFIDPETNEPYKVSLLLGLKDPDESNYEFNTSNRDIYYIDSVDEASKGYFVRSDGLYRNDWTRKDYANAEFFVRLVNESSFEFTTNTLAEGSMGVPYFYSIKYQIKYDPNGNFLLSEVKGTMDNQDVIEGYNDLTENKYSAAGYKFVGWNTKPDNKGDSYTDKDILKLIESDFGKELIVKTLYAQWEPIEYKLAYDKNHENAKYDGAMEDDKAVIGDNATTPNKFTNRGYAFAGWSETPGKQDVKYDDGADVPVTAAELEGKESGDVVKTLYAQWTPKEYQIIYNKNAEDAKGEMAKQKFDVETNPDTWDSTNPWTFTREGYDLAGYLIENDGEMLPTDAKDYKDILLDDEDQKVELFAQWKPWEYYIKYDGNGADNPGAMPTDTFSYFATSMRSKDNLFKKEGHRFMGFKVTINGNVRIVRSPEEFKDILKNMKPYSSITLVAQWDKLPKGYSAPVTGIE